MICPIIKGKRKDAIGNKNESRWVGVICPMIEGKGKYIIGQIMKADGCV
jgi:hypothetical protein